MGTVVLSAWIAAAGPLLAQQSAPDRTNQPSPPSASKPTSMDAQETGGTAVHTGVTSGLDTEARLQNLLADHQFPRIAAQLDQLPPEQAQFYRGILSNRNNDLKTSIELLEPLLDTVADNPSQEKLLRKTLAEDYLRIGDFAKANRAYQALETRLEAKLTPEEQDEIELPVKLLPLASTNPPMTVEPYEPFWLQVTRNPLGLTDLPVYVDARPHAWMLDPTAPFNLIARSLAKEAGLKVSEESATIHSLTGRPIQVHMTVIPRFTIGGRITFRNMTAFVFEDADYAFAKSHYQVEGVLGYPAVSALGSLTVTSDATIEVQPFKSSTPEANGDHPVPGARFFLDGDQIIVALGVPNRGDARASDSKPNNAAGEDRMFVLDASGQHTYLTSRYYDEHTADFAGQKMEMFSLPNSPGTEAQPAFTAETVPLAFGPTIAEVHYLHVLTQPLGSAVLDDVYGLLGMDVLDQLQSYTFDWRTMTFSVKTVDSGQ